MSTADFVRHAIGRQLKRPGAAVAVDHNLREDLGADGLDLIEIVMEIEVDLGVSLGDADMQATTVGDLIEAVERARCETARSRRVTVPARIAVNRWNVQHQPGTLVVYRRDDGRTLRTQTRTDATVLGSNTAVIWLENITGCVALDRITAIDTGAA